MTEQPTNGDLHGQQTLQLIAQADRFNEWMYEMISPFISGNVLEIGSGIGNMSEAIMRTAASVHLSDVNEHYLAILHNRFAGEKKMAAITLLDLVDPGFDYRYTDLFDCFDTIVALNVIEHIDDDYHAIHNCIKMLKPGGNLVILVPAFPRLYNRFDKELGHCRRYSRQRLTGLLGQYLTVIKSSYFNFAGIFGWFVSGAILKNKIIPAAQLRLFNGLVPLFRLVDKAVSGRAGLSAIVVGKLRRLPGSGADTASNK